jgi:hypothetical protein
MFCRNIASAIADTTVGENPLAKGRLPLVVATPRWVYLFVIVLLNSETIKIF